MTGIAVAVLVWTCILGAVVLLWGTLVKRELRQLPEPPTAKPAVLERDRKQSTYRAQADVSRFPPPPLPTPAPGPGQVSLR